MLSCGVAFESTVETNHDIKVIVTIAMDLLKTVAYSHISHQKNKKKIPGYRQKFSGAKGKAKQQKNSLQKCDGKFFAKIMDCLECRTNPIVNEKKSLPN